MSSNPSTVLEEKKQILNFLDKCTLEVTPGGAAKIPDFRELIRDSTTVFVTFLPGSDFSDTIKTVKKLHDEGMNPVPHFAARSIPNLKFFEESLIALQGEAEVNEALIIGGGVDTPLGDFSSSMEILQTDLFQKYGINKIGVAGHPEGSPDIPELDVKNALIEKNAYAKAHSLEMYITTQFCFEAEPIIRWDRELREIGNELPVHIGIPGLATIKTLLAHSKACGIGPSMRFLTRQAGNLAKLMTTKMPDKLVRQLARYHHEDPQCGITRCHLYPLGGMRKSAAWLYAVQDGDFELNDADGFKLLRDID
jgi:methylenetetrahydrofolate reductase (NADPH)